MVLYLSGCLCRCFSVVDLFVSTVLKCVGFIFQSKNSPRGYTTNETFH